MTFDWSRLKNYGLWVSILSAIPLVLKSFGVNIIPDDYNTVITTVLSILVALGILNNPTTAAKWYLDDKATNTEEK